MVRKLERIEKEILSNGVAKSKPYYGFHDFVYLLASIDYGAILIVDQFDGFEVEHLRKITLVERSTNNWADARSSAGHSAGRSRRRPSIFAAAPQN